MCVLKDSSLQFEKKSHIINYNLKMLKAYPYVSDDVLHNNIITVCIYFVWAYESI